MDENGSNPWNIKLIDILKALDNLDSRLLKQLKHLKITYIESSS